MRRKYLTSIFLVFFLGSLQLVAQETILSKQEAVAQALENNFGIKVAKNQVEIAENNQSILNTGFLPTLTGSAGATYNRDDATIEFPGQFQENGDPRPDVELIRLRPSGIIPTFL